MQIVPSSLFVLPNLLAKEALITSSFPPLVTEIMGRIDGLLAESQKGALSFFKHFRTKRPPHQMPFSILNRKTERREYSFLLEPMLAGESWGMISDAGLPCIADPGACFIRYAREQGITVHAIPGPSSLFLALMLSGLKSQRFSFQGYLPKNPEERKQVIRRLEKRSYVDREVIVCIETPYRNECLFQAFLETLHDRSQLSVARSLTSSEEEVSTRSIAQWRQLPALQWKREPCIFLFLSGDGYN